jgi:transposase-like protein
MFDKVVQCPICNSTRTAHCAKQGWLCLDCKIYFTPDLQRRARQATKTEPQVRPSADHFIAREALGRWVYRSP